MAEILKMYYGIEHSIDSYGYFYHQDRLYYWTSLYDISTFLNVYHYYRYMMGQCGFQGYVIVKNQYQELFSQNHVLLLYQKGPFSFPKYFQQSMRLYPLPKVKVKDMKEQWIAKIDQAREKVKEYAYSFKHDQDVISLIYYYCGMGENSISILNSLLQIDLQASLPLSLSLIFPIENYVYELLNPCYYMISTRIRQLVCLLRSRFLTSQQIQDILEHEHFDVYELIYFYARLLYPSQFFYDLFHQRLDEKTVQSFYAQLGYERLLCQEVMEILSFYVALPKISWLHR